MTITLTEHDDGGGIRVQVGDVIEVRLPENASAGYRWSADNLDSRLFELTGAGGVYPPAATGSGGQVHVRVTVHAPGNGMLRFKYGRSWEGEAGVLKRFAVGVEASDA